MFTDTHCHLYNEYYEEGIDKKMIDVAGGLSSLGMHIVTLNLHKKVIAELKVRLVQK